MPLHFTRAVEAVCGPVHRPTSSLMAAGDPPPATFLTTCVYSDAST